MRLHRSIRKINATKVADRAELYLEGCRTHRSLTNQIRGLKSTKRIRERVKKIDSYEREMIRLEEKIERLSDRRKLAAAKLEEDIEDNLEVLEEYLEKSEIKDFK